MASVFKRGKTWTYVVDIGIDPATGKRRQKSKGGFARKKDAEIAAAEIKRQVMEQTFVKPKNALFEEVFNEWWENHITTIKQSTQYSLLSKFNRHILPNFGKLPISKISRAYCQKYINELAEKMKSAHDIKIQANQVFKYAIKMEYIQKNPMEHVIVPKSDEHFLSDRIQKRNFWTKDEVLHFNNLSKTHMDSQNFILFYMLIFTGMRKGELLALHWRDIDLANRTILIHQTIFFKENKEILQRVKTYQSRTISIDPTTVKVLQKWRIQQKEYLLSKGSNNESDALLCRADMRHLRLAHPNDVLKSFIKKHNLHSITVHGLRHTHASILFEAGATIKEVQDRLGHRDIKTTMDIYTHVTNAVKEQTAEKFSQYMSLE